MFLVSFCSYLCPIHWSHALSQEWKCSWSNADIWVINNVIAHCVATYVRSLTVIFQASRDIMRSRRPSHYKSDVLILLVRGAPALGKGIASPINCNIHTNTFSVYCITTKTYATTSLTNIHDDVIKWKHFPRYWPFDRWIPRTKARDAELWCFLWFAPEETVE